jgi:hypothetical protein
LRQRSQERPDPDLKFRIVRGCRQQHADALHALACCAMRGERPGRCRRAETLDELRRLIALRRL